MFDEPLQSGILRGRIEVICGCMFSGKTEELMRRLKRARIANQRTGIFKPRMDFRFDETSIVSHDDNRIVSTVVEGPEEMLALARGLEVVAIDEAQFFDESLPVVCNQLARFGIRIMVAGLDMDYKGKPFGPIPEMLAMAEYITKLHAICVKCGNIASYSYRKSADKSRVLLGEKDLYEPRCRICYQETEGVNNSPVGEF